MSSQNSQSHASSPQTALATVARRIQYKILLLSYKITLRHAPFYLRDLLPSYQPTRCLRSSSSNALVVPRTRGKAGNSVFAGAAPRLWNALAHKLKCVANINIKKKSSEDASFYMLVSCIIAMCDHQVLYRHNYMHRLYAI